MRAFGVGDGPERVQGSRFRPHTGPIPTPLGIEGRPLMWKLAVGVLGPTLLIATAAVAQPVVDSIVFGQGQQLYQDHCALCHQDTGTGNPPTFPALSGNDQLGEPWSDRQRYPAGHRHDASVP